MPVDRTRRHMLEALHAHGFTDLNASHFQVLRWPGPRGERPVELAAQAGTTRQAMNYLLGQLEGLDYVERCVDPDDTRSRRVYLTERGTSTISVIRKAITELEREWEASLGTEDFGQLKRLLARLNEAAAADGRTATTGAKPGANLRTAVVNSEQLDAVSSATNSHNQPS